MSLVVRSPSGFMLAPCSAALRAPRATLNRRFRDCLACLPTEPSSVWGLSLVGLIVHSAGGRMGVWTVCVIGMQEDCIDDL